MIDERAVGWSLVAMAFVSSLVVLGWLAGIAQPGASVADVVGLVVP